MVYKSKIRHAQKKLSAKFRENRQRLGNFRKRKTEDSAYISGAFSTSIHPDIDFKKQKTDDIPITFVSENDVVEFITLETH